MTTLATLRRSVPALVVAALVAACGSVGAPSAAAPSRSTSAAAVSPTGTPAGGDLRGEVPARSASAAPLAVTAAPVATAPPSVTPPPQTPTPAPPTPRPTATPEPPPPAEPFAMNLYREGDYVRQHTLEWCVGASIQMTLAMTGSSDDMSRARQQELWEMARDTSFSPFGGANPNGWVATLNNLGVGPYEMVSEPSLDAAIRRAAAAIAETNRPVGLVMWRGRHAWMMSGFESLGDPRVHPDFAVTGIRVLDPLHPHGSRRWGPSPEPNALITPEVLGRQFVARTGGRVKLPVGPGYILILPTTA